MDSTRRTLATLVVVALLLAQPAAAATWANRPGYTWPSVDGWIDWLYKFVNSLWQRPEEPRALIGREGGDMDPNGTPSEAVTKQASVPAFGSSLPRLPTSP